MNTFTKIVLVTLLALTTILYACNKQEPLQTDNKVAERSKSDKIKPIVTITSPIAGTIIAPGSTFTVTANATDNIGVTKVGFTFNGNYKSMVTGPYVATYTMPSFVTAGMTMWVIAEANDAAGNSGFQQIYLKVGQP
jgi:hypothetical protein